MTIAFFLFLCFARPENKDYIYFFFFSISSLTFYISHFTRTKNLFVFENEKHYIQSQHLAIFRDLKEESKEKYIKTK